MKGNSTFSLSSRNKRNCFQISLSPLETGEREFNFLFLLSKLEKLFSNFSFSSRKWGKGIQISLSLLDWTFLPLVIHWLQTIVQYKVHSACFVTLSFYLCVSYASTRSGEQNENFGILLSSPSTAVCLHSHTPLPFQPGE